MRNKTQNNHFRILIVDDEPLIRESLYEILRIDGYRAHMAPNGEEALAFVKTHKVDIIVTDLKLPRISGLDLLESVKAQSPHTEVIVITGYGSVETAVEAMKKGAYDYITKPINDNEVKLIIRKIIEHKNVLAENENLRQVIARNTPSQFCNMIGSSEKMQKVYHIIESVASSNATILISGESGTGKGLVARAIHEKDKNRIGKPFVEISCGALSETLLESELFGHVKGAFTGAIKDKEGRFEYANGGTVFLDEIDAFSPNLQVKLLRVLQYGTFERVGDNIVRKADARIIVATNRNLTDLVAKGSFREDLYYRINVIAVHLPPLRERKEDLDILVEHFIANNNKKNNKNITMVAPDVKKLFWEYNWPGNIRELENAVEGAMIMTKTNVINRWDIPNSSRFSPATTNASEGKSLKEVIIQPERDLIISVLKQYSWNRNKAAAALGINRTTLYNKMKRYNISFEKGK